MRKLVTLIVTFFTALFMMVNVEASGSLGASVDTNHKDIKGGEEVEITLKFDGFKDIK